MKHTSPLFFIFGQDEYIADGKDITAILNLFMEYGIVYRDLSTDAQGKVKFFLSPIASYLYRRALAKKGTESKAERVGSRGLLYVLRRYRRRYGLMIGAVAAILIIWFAGTHLFDIRLTGNETVTYGEVVGLLAENGIAVGDRISSLDVDKTETLVLLKSDKISWMTVNIIGNCAEVQIREEKAAPDKDGGLLPANVVASRDGQIDHLEVFSGYASVRTGDTVRAGDVLISGIRDSNSAGFDFTRAAGDVYAETERNFTVVIPLEYEVKKARERKLCEKSINFFSKSIKLFGNSGNVGSSCDTISSENILCLPGGVRLPIGIKDVYAVNYETESVPLGDGEAIRLAYSRIYREMREAIPGATVLRRSFDGEFTDDAYVLHCRVRCIENIAVISEFEADVK